MHCQSRIEDEADLLLAFFAMAASHEALAAI
jgi:hypothetical protein